jgi:Na+-driven multidrug efflux pump
MPLAMAFVTVSRGMLIARRNTRPQAVAMLLELLTLVVILSIGVNLQLPGVPVAAVGLSAALLIEGAFLWAVLNKTSISSGLRRLRAGFLKPWQLP